jgi:hypothetical protein
VTSMRTIRAVSGLREVLALLVALPSTRLVVIAHMVETRPNQLVASIFRHSLDTILAVEGLLDMDEAVVAPLIIIRSVQA